MCIYVRMMPLCGHPPSTLLSYASCGAVLAQLLRIAEPEAWATPEARGHSPFDLPDDCGPREGENIWTLYSDDYCGWECRNNAYLVRSALGCGDGLVAERDGGLLPACLPGDEDGGFVLGHSMHGDQVDEYVCGTGVRACGEAMVVGMPDANYGPGSERLGIGWRSDGGSS